MKGCDVDVLQWNRDAEREHHQLLDHMKSKVEAFATEAVSNARVRRRGRHSEDVSHTQCCHHATASDTPDHAIALTNTKWVESLRRASPMVTKRCSCTSGGTKDASMHMPHTEKC